MKAILELEVRSPVRTGKNGCFVMIRDNNRQKISTHLSVLFGLNN